MGGFSFIRRPVWSRMCRQMSQAVDVEQLAARMPHYREFDEIDILSIGYWYVTCRGSVRYEPPIPEQESEVPV